MACTSPQVTPETKLGSSGPSACTWLPTAALPASTWQARENPELNPTGGPYVWKNVVILGGGFVSGVVFGPSGILYARTDVGGAYRWDDGPNGVSDGRWVPLLDWVGRSNSNLTGVESIAVDPTDPDTVYAAAGEYVGTTNYGEILSSHDRGSSWSEHVIGVTMGGNADGRSTGERLAVDPNLPSTLYFGSRQAGLQRSTDSGATWQRVASFPLNGDAPIGLTLVHFDARSGSAGSASQIIYVGVASNGGQTQPIASSAQQPSLYRTLDGGETWAAVPDQPLGWLPQHAALDGNGVLYVAYADAPGPAGYGGSGQKITSGAVYKFDTQSGAWMEITPHATDGSVLQVGYGGLALDAQHPGTLLVSTIDVWSPDKLFRATDGATFSELSSRALDVAGAAYLYWHKPANGPINGGTGWAGSIAVDPTNPDRALHVSGQGVWWTDDLSAADRGQPTHWSFRDVGLEETVPLALISPPSGAQLISGLGDIGGFAHDDLDAPPPQGQFDTPIYSNTVALDFAENDPLQVVRAGTLSGGSCGMGAFSLDGAKSWQPFAVEPAGSNGQGSIAIAADGSTILWVPNAKSSNGTSTGAGGTSGATPPPYQAFNYSADHGQTWVASAGIAARYTGSVAADRVNPQLFYALVSAPRARRGDPAMPATVYVSSDGGRSFAATSTMFSGSPSLRTVFGHEGDVWIAGGSGVGLYHSSDRGASFALIAGTSDVYDVAFGKPKNDGDYPAIYLAGTVAGVAGFFRSDDAGANFVRINDDQHQFGYINRIAADRRRYGRVYLATGGRGVIYGDVR